MTESKSKPSAIIIADSMSPDGVRLTTMEVKMHRYVLAEFNTHRVFSRNSASSRAIPVKRMLKMVEEDPAYPLHWGHNQTGMQANEELDYTEIEQALVHWDNHKNYTIETVKSLDRLGLHKQVANRLLEPFMWHTVIVTATEWANFFNQRCDKNASPEIKAAADAMQLAYYQNTPRNLDCDDWHLPYIKQKDWADIEDWANNPIVVNFPYQFACQLEIIERLDLAAKWISTARCARVSYLTHDGVRDVQADIDMFHTKLLHHGHWSPFEHVARPLRLSDLFDDETQEEVKAVNNAVNMSKTFSGNFRGWKQFRKEFKNENRTTFVPNLPELEGLQ